MSDRHERKLLTGSVRGIDPDEHRVHLLAAVGRSARQCFRGDAYRERLIARAFEIGAIHVLAVDVPVDFGEACHAIGVHPGRERIVLVVTHLRYAVSSRCRPVYARLVVRHWNASVARMTRERSFGCRHKDVVRVHPRFRSETSRLYEQYSARQKGTDLDDRVDIGRTRGRTLGRRVHDAHRVVCCGCIVPREGGRRP
jgi:hypothetical protein